MRKKKIDIDGRLIIRFCANPKCRYHNITNINYPIFQKYGFFEEIIDNERKEIRRHKYILDNYNKIYLCDNCHAGIKEDIEKNFFRLLYREDENI